MVNWGLGIEHEMRIRFTNKLTILNLDDFIIKKIVEDYKYIPDYLFIESNFLLNLFTKYSIKILDYYNNKNSKNSKNSKNNKKLNINNENPFVYIKYCIDSNVEYPLEHSTYFNDNIDSWIDYLRYYIWLYNEKYFLFSSKTFMIKDHLTMNDTNSISINIILMKVLYNSIYDKNKLKIFFTKLKKGVFEKEYKNYLKKYIESNTFINNIEYKWDDNINYIILSYKKENKKKFTFETVEKFCKKYNFIVNKNKNKLNTFFKKFDNKKLLKELDNMINLKIPHIDYSSQTTALEFKTYDFKNNNYKKQLDDLMYIEQVFFTIVNEIPELQNYIEKFGKIIYHNTGSLEETIILKNTEPSFKQIKKDYAGSFHIWITIPYEEKDSPEKFVHQHASLGNRLQLLEPIFSSYFTSPDMNSIGNNLTHSRTSLRQFLNEYAGYGTSNVLYLNGVDNTFISEYYLSKNDYFKNNHILLYKNKKIYDSIDNKPIINYNGLNTRDNTVDLYKKYFSSHKYESNINNIKNNNINIENYLIKIFKKTNITPEDNHIPLGADIRTLDMNLLFYPELLPEFKEIYILENNKFIKYYIDLKKNEFTEKPIFNAKKYKKLLKEERVGIEFRILDHQPTSNLIQLLAICAQIVTFSINNHKKINKEGLFIYKQLWHDELYKSMINGFEYKLNEKYVQMIEKEFKIDFGKNKDNINGQVFFENFYQTMNTKLSKNKIYNKLKIDKQYIIFENFNEKVWIYNFYLFLEKHPTLLSSIASIIFSNKNNNTQKKELLDLLGHKFKYDIDKIKTIIHNNIKVL